MATEGCWPVGREEQWCKKFTYLGVEFNQNVWSFWNASFRIRGAQPLTLQSDWTAAGKSLQRRERVSHLTVQICKRKVNSVGVGLFQDMKEYSVLSWGSCGKRTLVFMPAICVHVAACVRMGIVAERFRCFLIVWLLSWFNFKICGVQDTIGRG